MRYQGQSEFNETVGSDRQIDVTIVMPCLNEKLSLPHCVGNALDALARMQERFGLAGEIVIADNGSDDGSPEIAESLGARVVHVKARGYGAAMIGGGHAAEGRFIVFGDCDGSYNFTESVEMIGELLNGAELCMGSRFKGGIAEGAMPWKNRYIGNPLLTGILNLFFRTGVSDAHCGLRAIRSDTFQRLRLSGRGMEFASEMVIKAALLKCRITEVPATLSPDLRERQPHLRPWRDGWRHLRYLLMLSPTWLFGIPAAAFFLLGLLVFGLALRDSFLPREIATFGTSWTILAGALIGIGHIGGLLTAATRLYGVRQGYRTPHAATRWLARTVTLETMLITGVVLGLAGTVLLALVGVHWSNSGYEALRSVIPLVGGTTLLVTGMQNILGGFLLAVIAGNEAAFFEPLAEQDRAAHPSGASIGRLPELEVR